MSSVGTYSTAAIDLSQEVKRDLSIEDLLSMDPTEAMRALAIRQKQEKDKQMRKQQTQERLLKQQQQQEKEKQEEFKKQRQQELQRQQDLDNLIQLQSIQQDGIMAVPKRQEVRVPTSQRYATIPLTAAAERPVRLIATPVQHNVRHVPNKGAKKKAEEREESKAQRKADLEAACDGLQ
jgi:hypothetical protein